MRPTLMSVFLEIQAYFIGKGGYRNSDSPMPRGEVIIGGYSITNGYFNNEAKTDEVYKVDVRGICWFYTGDIGQLRPDGCIEIIDREKYIFEPALHTSNYVESIMAYADPFHTYCVALVVSPHQALKKWAQNSGISYKDIEQLCHNDQAIKEVQQSLSKGTKAERLEKFEIPAKIVFCLNVGRVWLVTKREKLKTKFQDDLKKLDH
ncbi:hypothetical protein CFC21_044686 [Triticum aestivum]|uniref:Uncharacterized protein n=2 Tax=Triticum aestivum TaxID=4565 RepID=A0A3B6FY16_WHEAT|nr:long chain acyl-CoA synthetase 8-like isoform X1 [Triticum aestivum]KAF7033601.1 hypothetical protein CFC21_044686 [Triticum aestivum]